MNATQTNTVSFSIPAWITIPVMIGTAAGALTVDTSHNWLLYPGIALLLFITMFTVITSMIMMVVIVMVVINPAKWTRTNDNSQSRLGIIVHIVLFAVSTYLLHGHYATTGTGEFFFHLCQFFSGAILIFLMVSTLAILSVRK